AGQPAGAGAHASAPPLAGKRPASAMTSGPAPVLSACGFAFGTWPTGASTGQFAADKGLDIPDPRPKRHADSARPANDSKVEALETKAPLLAPVPIPPAVKFALPTAMPSALTGSKSALSVPALPAAPRPAMFLPGAAQGPSKLPSVTSAPL